jgi:polyphosphate:AMP phosphotransferase
MWRFWRALPPKGKVGIFFGSWYSLPILDRVYKRTKNGELDKSLDDIQRFERMLSDEGALIVKFWFHLTKKKQKKRFRDLLAHKSTSWRVTDADWSNHRRYDDFLPVSEYALRKTSTEYAPWIVVEGYDARYRNLTVARTLLEALTKRLAESDHKARSHASPIFESSVDSRSVLRSLDLSKKIPEKRYDKDLAKLQARLNELSREKKFKRTSVVLAFEGADAAGKGGAIRRVTEALDARAYHVIPIAAPTEEERAQPYLWRFWRHLPRRGHAAIFDRSWYGRVLVERVEGFAPPDDWMRAYQEINDFEEKLVAHDMVVCKFWLQISKSQQLRRFEDREHTPYKRFKITEEDWRNRKKWSAYERAVCDMIDRTSTEIAPWTLVPAEDKHYARIQVLETVCDAIERAL